MNNLFICHSQAQLTLACGLSKVRFNNDNNELILHMDFDVKDEMRQRLRSVFNRVLYLQGVFPAENATYKAKLQYYPRGLKHAHNFLNDKYDRVFVVCDTVVLTQKIIQCVWKLNTQVEINYLEDGIITYYRDNDMTFGLDSSKRSLLLRKIIFKYIFGVGKFYNRDFIDGGGMKCIKNAYVLFPGLVREPYKSQRNLIGITSEEYYEGLKSLYSIKPMSIADNAIILVVDKLDRYKYSEEVRTALATYIQNQKAQGKTIYCKFHPREETHWEIFNSCHTLEKSIGIESIYLSLYERRNNILIAGIKSTGLMSAKMMGYPTVSLFKLCKEKNDNLLTFYSALNIPLVEAE